MPKQIYRPRCSVCQFMKRNPQFRMQIMDSTYFKEDGEKTPAEVVHAWGDPFKLPALYAHFKRHQAADLVRTAVRYRDDGKIEVDRRFKDTVEIISAEPDQPKMHEKALGEFIQRGRDLLAAGELKVTAPTLVQAIRTQAEIDAKNKDRKLDLLKSMFAGASNTKNDDGTDARAEERTS